MPHTDPWGRLVSDDGKWYWTGREWRAYSPPPPIHSTPAAAAPVTPVAHVQPTPAPTAAAAVAAGTAFNPIAEAKGYPTMWRMAGRALKDVPAMLHPGEQVLATAPGEGSLPQFHSLAIVAGLYLEPAYLLVATDRRVLALGLTVSASKVQQILDFPYGAITHWRAELSRAATLVTKTGSIGIAAGADKVAGVRRLPGDRFHALRAVVEPRLGAGVSST